MADTVQKYGKHRENFGDGTQHAKESLGTGRRVCKVELSEWSASGWTRGRSCKVESCCTSIEKADDALVFLLSQMSHVFCSHGEFLGAIHPALL